jgi:hypothetical protein
MIMQSKDGIIMLLIVAVLVVVLLTSARSWWNNPPKKSMPIPFGGDIPQDETTELLEGAGFDIVSAKVHIPVQIKVNETQSITRNLFIDFFVRKNDEFYVAIVAREHKKIDLTGSSIRDLLLPYHLMYPEAAGILYVDMQLNKIKKITFHIEV